MEEAPAGVVMALRAAGAPALPPPAPEATVAAAAPSLPGRRQRFAVELRAGETTIVSWRKLVRDGSRAGGAAPPPPPPPAGAHPALEARITPAADQPVNSEQQDVQPQGNRFSAVIEKIERLYMGKESSDDEELGDIPDDDQYDTEDSFIDDTELNDYFQVDKSTTKHQGFFVNRGKLEHMEASSSPSLVPKKRRRKDSLTVANEKDSGFMSTDFVDVKNMKMKNAARHAPLVGKSSSSPSNAPTHHGVRYQDGKNQKTKLNMHTETLKKKMEHTILHPEAVSKTPNRELTVSMEMKDHKEQKVAAAQSRETNKVKTEEALDMAQDPSREKGPSLKGDNNQVSSMKIRARERNGTIELPDLNIPGNMYPMQATTETLRAKEGTARPKGSILERAIHDLERVVVEFRPPKQEIQVADSTQGVKKRLPIEIKQKLAKVARLANSQGRIASEDFLNRLMGILGHLVQQKTLKRHLKEMVELGLSAKQAKADRFQQIKKEVIEMVKTRISSSRSRVGEQQTGSSDDLDTSSERSLKAKMSMDEAIEDKICDLYDLYVEGMDEDKGPQTRKLYVELAELWPAGYVDSSVIKEALHRAKARRRTSYKQHKVSLSTHTQDEKLKRKRLSSTARLEDGARMSNQSVAGGQDRLSDAVLPLNGSSDHYASKDKGVSRSNASISTDAASRAIVAMKKAKKSPEGASTASRAHIPKPSSANNDKDGSFKSNAYAAEAYLVKSSHNSAALPSSEQPIR